MTALLSGKTVLITGGTGGIGFATATALAQKGARVVLIGRDATRGRDAVRHIQHAAGHNNVHLLTADLSEQAEVRRVADEFLTQFRHLDVLINNVAGVYRERQVTVDGIEKTFALGHLAPFLLTHLLLPALSTHPQSRIINLTSNAVSMAKLDFDDLQSEKWYRGLDVYLRAKLANLSFSQELARRLARTGITVNATDPGGAKTTPTQSTTPDMMPPIFRLMMPIMGRMMLTTPEKAAVSTIYAASDPNISHVTGVIFNNKFKQVNATADATDATIATRLWDISAQLTGVTDGELLAL